MLFNSLHFLIFFPLVTLIYFWLPPRRRWAWLLLASYYFYMSWEPAYLLLIVGSTLIDYWAGRQMGQRADRPARRPFLLVSLAANLGLLFTFKYFNFFRDSLAGLFSFWPGAPALPALDLLLPVGISFYTFQTLSYSIDVYRGQKEAEKNLGIFALYVAFFPQLVAGPIERATRLLPQFHQSFAFDEARVVSGLQRMLWGFFKKLVIADRLALLVNRVYGAPEAFGGLSLILATYFFAWQIFCDFSGYSDIAIGAARVLGFDLMENFTRPYFARSVAEFWRRWHISLSTWFRDYLYIPLGGNRVPVRRWYANLFIVFVVSGLWHGASWTFVVWGALHGLYLLLEIWLRPAGAWLAARLRRPAVYRPLAALLTFHLVTFAWIFFRADNVGDAFYIAGHLAAGWSRPLAFSSNELIMALAPIALLEGVHWLERRAPIWRRVDSRPIWLRWALYAGLIFAILFLGVFGGQEFIYFQF